MYQEELKKAYHKIKDIKLSFDIEDWDVVSLVHQYRMYWKPENVKILLLAESHVHTEPELLKEEFNTTPSLAGYPKEYVRFVYCLALEKIIC